MKVKVVLAVIEDSEEISEAVETTEITETEEIQEQTEEEAQEAWVADVLAIEDKGYYFLKSSRAITLSFLTIVSTFNSASSNSL